MRWLAAIARNDIDFDGVGEANRHPELVRDGTPRLEDGFGQSGLAVSRIGGRGFGIDKDVVYNEAARSLKPACP